MRNRRISDRLKKLNYVCFREWTEFTEAMNEEVVKSNQLLEEEDEYGNLARDIGKYFNCLKLNKF